MERGIIHIVRHSQGVHNTIANPSPTNPSLRDADLTIKGQRQSILLSQEFPSDYMKAVGLVMTSPLRRAIHTTLLAFTDILDKRYYLNTEGGVDNGVPLIIDPSLQESDDAFYNTGSTAADLRAEWPHLNLSLLTRPWPDKNGRFAPANASNIAMQVREDLWDKINALATSTTMTERKNIVVVTHGGFMQTLMDLDDLVIENGKFKTFGINKISGEVKFSPISEP